MRRKALAIAAILIVTIGGLLVLPSQQVTALGKKVMHMVTVITGGTLTTNTTLRENSKTTPEQSVPPPEASNPGSTRQEAITLEQARKMSPFPFRTPQYLPDGFQLKQVKLVKSEDIAIITLEYGRQNSELFIYQENVIGEMAASDNARADKAELKEIDILGNRGTMIKFKNGLTTVSLLADGIKFQVNGYLKPDIMLKVTQSLIE